jgi:hypothetical protein
MACEGTVSIRITYRSRTTHTVALVSSCLSEEVLIGWQDLVGLAVIHEGFPAQIKVVSGPDDRQVDLTTSSAVFRTSSKTGRSSP